MTESETKITKPSEIKPLPTAVQDESQFANLLDTAKFEHLWRVASLFAKSNLVPETFRGKPEDCFIAIQMAIRLGVEPFMFLQKTYVVHGRPGMEAQLAIALINARGPFTGPIQWRFEGDGENRTCIAYATHRITGEICEAPVSWKMVVGERWNDKRDRDGKSIPSKWNTMPEIMFRYRSATFLGRLYAPECLMGLLTQDELEDIPPTKIITSEIIPAGQTKTERLANKLAATKPTEPVPESETPTPEPKRGPGRPRKESATETPAPEHEDHSAGRDKMMDDIVQACAKIGGNPEAGAIRLKVNYGILDLDALKPEKLIELHTKVISDVLAFETEQK